MIPKIFYLVVCLLVALVAATPVGEQAGTKGQASQPKPKPIDINTHVEKFKPMGNLGVRNMNIGGRFNGYATHLKLKPSSVSDAHIAGLAEAAWWEMYKQFNEDVKATPADKALQTKLPTVMTALKVGDEVFLASSLKGGGYIYDNKGLKKLTENLKTKNTNNNEEFTSVLKDTHGAKELMEALVSCRDESIATTKPKQMNTPAKRGLPRGANKDKKKGTTDGKGNRNTAGGSTDPNKKQESSNNQVGSSTTGSSNQIAQGLLKHRNEGSCGEIMASLEYYLLNPSGALKNSKPQPTVVAWEEKARKDKTRQLTGEVYPGGIKPPCDTKGTNSEGCGEGWGCEAFTGKKGMNFHVVPTGTKSDYLKEEEIVVKDVPEFPVPTEKST